MILLSLYALVVWWVAAKHRRTWKAFVFTAAGGAFVLPLVDPLVYLVWWMMGEKPVWLFPFMYAYAAVLLVVGCMLSVLPRGPRGVPCQACGYDLTGNATGLCPECGREVPGDVQPATAASRRARAS